MEGNLTEGSVFKTVLRFSLPFLLSYFLQTLYGMADLYIIGRFCGVKSTTAVSIGSQVMHMLTVMIVGLSMGPVVLIGQAVGASNPQRASRSVGNTITLFMVLAGILLVLLQFLTDPIISLMSTPEEAKSGTWAYLKICFLGIPFIVAYNTISAVFRGMGDSKSPMYFAAAACTANILLDYLLIGGLDLGPAGAALGTILAQAVSVLLSLLFIRRKKNRISVSSDDLKPESEILRKILKVGIPVALQDGFIQIAFLLITVFANHRGLRDAAAVGIVEKLIGILFLVPSSMLQTVSALSAQNIGAGKEDRARKTLAWACSLSVFWGITAVILMYFKSPQIIGLFSADIEVVESGCRYMKSYVWDCMFAGIHFSFSGFFCALGLSGLSFLHNAVSIVCVRVPLSYLAARYCPDSLFPMGLASPAGSLLSVIICLTVYKILRKKRNG